MKIFIIAGPNGAGKTTFARFFLKNCPEITHYLNADVLASGLAPHRPELAAVEAGKILLHQMDQLTAQKTSFAFETTLSAKNYLQRTARWRRIGYEVQLVFLSLPTPSFAAQRVRQRVRQGGHNIPGEIIERRFARGLKNLPQYKKLVNAWQIFDNSTDTPVLMEEGSNESKAG